MDKQNVHPSKVVSLGDDVDVMVLEIDADRRRISLGMKQCKINPWYDFETKYKKGDQVSGKIRSITDFGVFIGFGRFHRWFNFIYLIFPGIKVAKKQLKLTKKAKR